MSKKRILAIIYRHMSMWKRDFDRIADTFWWPVLDLIIWGFVTVFVQKQSGSALTVLFFIGGAILWGVVNRAQLDIGMSFLQEAWDRNLLNIFASPITIAEFITATIILGIIKLSLSLLMVSLLAWLLYAFNILKFGLYLVPFIANLLMMGWWVGLIVTALIIRFGYRVQAFAWTLLFIFHPISAVFYPLAILPSWLQFVARLFPAAYVFEGMRAILKEGRLHNDYLLVAFLLNIIYLSASLVFYKYMFLKAKEKGYLTQFT